MSEIFRPNYERSLKIDPSHAFVMSNNNTLIETEKNIPNFINSSFGESDKSLFSFLLSNAPDFVPAVPGHWLRQDFPSYNDRFYVALSFLIICLPSNIGHLVAFSAFVR